MKYKVVWEIEVSANSSIEAAKKALKIQRDPESIATVFNVIDAFEREQTVDLDDFQPDTI